MNPHLARALLFLGGISMSVLAFRIAPFWPAVGLSVLFVVLAHVLGDRAFNRLATHDEVIQDLRSRVDAVD